MRTRRQSVCFACFAAWLAVWLQANLASGQTEEIDFSNWKRGYHGYGVLCRSLRLEIEDDSYAWTQRPPTERLLIVLGEPNLRVNRRTGQTLLIAEDESIDLGSFVRSGGALLIASDRGQSFPAFQVRILSGPRETYREALQFGGLADCPLAIINTTGENPRHESVRGCYRLATNKPGSLATARYYTTAALLLQVWSRQLRQEVDQQQFAAATEMQGGRALFIADQSIFSNQMIGEEDNAQFALSSLKWLRGDKNTAAMIIVDGHMADPMHPQDLQLPLPAPNPADVAAALKSLPPEVLIDFGNKVATTIEDNGVLDGIIERLTARFPQRTYQRVLVIAPTVLVLLYVLFRLSAARSEEGSRRSPKNKRGREFFERKQAAIALLDRFRADLTGSSATPWRIVLSRLRVPNRRLQTRSLRREIGRWATLARIENPWTSRRLQQLEAQIRRWRQLHERGALTYDFDHELVDNVATSG